MTSRAVLNCDNVVHDSGLRSGHRRPGRSPSELLLKGAEEGLRNRVVPAIPFAAHRGNGPDRLEGRHSLPDTEVTGDLRHRQSVFQNQPYGLGLEVRCACSSSPSGSLPRLSRLSGSVGQGQSTAGAHLSLHGPTTWPCSPRRLTRASCGARSRARPRDSTAKQSDFPARTLVKGHLLRECPHSRQREYPNGPRRPIF
jgi:hypothetical protein